VLRRLYAKLGTQSEHGSRSLVCYPASREEKAWPDFIEFLEHDSWLGGHMSEPCWNAILMSEWRRSGKQWKRWL
jgi:hypothetical protein